MLIHCEEQRKLTKGSKGSGFNLEMSRCRDFLLEDSSKRLQAIFTKGGCFGSQDCSVPL
jgi:hypothetical protein